MGITDTKIGLMKMKPKENELNEFKQNVGFTVDQWQPRKYPEKVILKGQYCNLIPLNVNEHAEELLKILSFENRGESWTYLPYGPFLSIEEFKDWLNIKCQEYDTFLYAISATDKNNLLGMCGYSRICREHGVIEIGHLHFSNLLKRTRLATEAIYLMMSYVFDDLLYRRCEWKCHVLNEASKRAAERFGFQFEGVFRQSHVYKNRSRDTAWFSVIDQEWPQLKIKFQKWLDANNFDEQGRQKLKFNEY